MQSLRFLFSVFIVFFHSTFCFAQSRYDAHLKAAQATGIALLKNPKHLNSYVKKKKLVSVVAGRGYQIDRLTHSKPYLTPKSYKTLKQIGQAFYTKSKKNTCIISSITRTLYDQKRLARVNRNAITSKPSSHNFGCSFDISYIRFNKKKAPNPRLEKIIETILADMQNKGKLYYIKERKEKCFHVTGR